jgi:hypothetical protein
LGVAHDREMYVIFLRLTLSSITVQYRTIHLLGIDLFERRFRKKD